MITRRQQARNFLDGSSLTDFWEIVREAKISDEDKSILDARFIHGRSYQQIADEFMITADTVKKRIAKAYDKIATLI